MGISQGVADDLTEAEGASGKAVWLLNATLRIGVSVLVIVLFLIATLLLNQRYRADAAVSGAQGLAQLADTGGALGASDTVDEERIAVARATEEARRAWDARVQIETQQTQRLASYGAALQGLAQRAGCDAATLDMALTCDPARASDETLRAELVQTAELYRAQHAALLETRSSIPPLISQYEVQRLLPGAELAGALPAVNARDDLVEKLPPWLRGFAMWFFSLPLLVSSTALAFLGGMLGAVVVLLVLLAAPNYLPLTFGGGKYFFLRVFTGGFLAVLVFVALQSGITVVGMGELQSAAGESNSSDPTKIALLGVFAGAFSEQIAGTIKSYVDRVLPGGGVVSEPPSDGATYSAPPEGGPRPQQG